MRCRSWQWRSCCRCCGYKVPGNHCWLCSLVIPFGGETLDPVLQRFTSLAPSAQSLISSSHSKRPFTVSVLLPRSELYISASISLFLKLQLSQSSQQANSLFSMSGTLPTTALHIAQCSPFKPHWYRRSQSPCHQARDAATWKQLLAPQTR